MLGARVQIRRRRQGRAGTSVPFFVLGLPHVTLLELRLAPSFRTRITTCCRSLSQAKKGGAAFDFVRSNDDVAAMLLKQFAGCRPPPSAPRQYKRVLEYLSRYGTR